MKQFAKRGLALLTAFVLTISLIPAMHHHTAHAAGTDVEYVYSGDYIYNWGTRGTLATFLSPNAEDFYTGDYTYDSLSQLSGETSDIDAPDSTLFAALYTLMSENHTYSSDYSTEYGNTRYWFQYTDCQNSAKDTTAISCFYSGAAIGPEWDEGATWNREHTWPNSKDSDGAETIREADIMMLRPTAKVINSSRGNDPYGEGSGYYNPNEASNGEHDVRGDVARIILYVYVRWGGDSVNANGALDNIWNVIASEEILLAWMAADPVDTWEMGRNDSVESITGTRNVFVDYPELAFLLFGEDIPSTLITPSGSTADHTHSFTSAVTTAATCTTDGVRTFTCSVCSISYTEVIPATGHNYVSGTCTDCGETEPVEYTATLVTHVSQLSAGAQIIIVAQDYNYALSTNQKSSNRGQADVAKSDDGSTVTFTDTAGVQIITLEAGTQSGTYAFNVGDGYLYAASSSSNQLKTEGTLSDNSSWLITIADGATTVTAQGTNTRNYMQYNTSGLFSCYGGSTQKAVAIYVIEDDDEPAVEETTTVTVSIADYAAANNWANSTKYTELKMDEVVAVTVNGGSNSGKYYTSGTNWRIYQNETPEIVISADDTTIVSVKITYTNSNTGVLTLNGENIESDTVVEVDASSVTFGVGNTGTATNGQIRITAIEVVYVASGEGDECEHTNTTVEGATDATCTAEGYTGNTVCSDCGTTVARGETIPALGHNYVDGVCTRCSEAEPSQITATLVTDVSELAVGDQIIIVADEYNYALSTTQNGNNRGQVQITKNSDGTVTFMDDAGVQIITLEAGNVTGTFAFNVGTGYLYAASSSSNYLKTETTLSDNSSWLITIADGATTVTAQGTNSRNKLQYNQSSSIFSCYSSTQKAVSIYVIDSGEPEPTPDPTPECEHVNTTVEGATEATCTEAGHTGKTVCSDCGETVNEGSTIPALGHDYVEGICSRCGAKDPSVVDPDATEATISFADDSYRTIMTTEQQVWVQNGITVTNDKASSTTNVANYFNPIRLYKNSSLTVAYPGMTKIVFNCNDYSNTYPTELVSSIGSVDGVTVTADGAVVTVTFAAAQNSFVIEALTAQVRMDSITVYTVIDEEFCEHANTTTEGATEATCTEAGHTGATVCADCG